MILLNNIFLSFKQQTIFNNITAHINAKWRIGLYGLNGAGKSTLLKAIAGFQQLEKGSICIEKGMVVAYMPQEVVLQSDRSILEETMHTFTELMHAQKTLKDLEVKLLHEKENFKLIDAYAHACDALIFQEPEKKHAECERILRGLGFSQKQLAEPVNSLSVGWKMRIILAQLLLKKADFYLFDEPTNHLDIVAKEWFLRFLKQSNAGFLLVCHEKQFLNALCNRIFALEKGNGTIYNGNYDAFIKQKEAKTEQLSAAFEQQQREIAQLEKTINRFRAGTRATQAKSMEKRLEKIERIVLPTESKKVSVSFGVPEPSGKQVLKVIDIAHSFGTKPIFKNCSFTIERGNKIAIVAPNGAGKTTLINIIMKKIPCLHGSLEWGNNVTCALFDQDQLQSLDLEKSVFENAMNVSHTISTKNIRTILGSFLFDSEAVGKKAGVLSGGERNRLGMVRVLLQNANFLLLDEPTNHLDIPSKEVLLDALAHYEGTILFVSHDQDFVNRLATHILELNAEQSVLFHGSYDDYVYQKENILIKNNPQTPPSALPIKDSSAKKQNTDTVQQRITTLEKKIAKTETDIKKLEAAFETLSYGTKEFDAAKNKLIIFQQELIKAMHEWENLINSS
ncbi:MAG TPA: ABC-F family ATP-binding cassette domain-containing protein [Patescibacteria group bacterium]|jgi:ATP-binding cassette subfamily F protein 3|nr:ABC-F family ATP-binding cassette domain-containing protein [Patescibacteria group bacterium]